LCANLSGGFLPDDPYKDFHYLAFTCQTEKYSPTTFFIAKLKGDGTVVNYVKLSSTIEGGVSGFPVAFMGSKIVAIVNLNETLETQIVAINGDLDVEFQVASAVRSVTNIVANRSKQFFVAGVTVESKTKSVLYLASFDANTGKLQNQNLQNLIGEEPYLYSLAASEAGLQACFATPHLVTSLFINTEDLTPFSFMKLPFAGAGSPSCSISGETFSFSLVAVGLNAAPTWTFDKEGKPLDSFKPSLFNGLTPLSYDTVLVENASYLLFPGALFKGLDGESAFITIDMKSNTNGFAGVDEIFTAVENPVVKADTQAWPVGNTLAGAKVEHGNENFVVPIEAPVSSLISNGKNSGNIGSTFLPEMTV